MLKRYLSMLDRQETFQLGKKRSSRLFLETQPGHLLYGIKMIGMVRVISDQIMALVKPDTGAVLIK